MTTPRSMFTEAIEDHLALKKQNAQLNSELPVARFDVGDPLDRYPGGPVRPALGTDDDAIAIGMTAATGAAAEGLAPAGAMATTAAATAAANAADTPHAGPSPADAARAAGQLLEGEFRRPLEPLNGMTPMLSLVEDIDEDDMMTATGSPNATALMSAIEESAPVLRFPGGVGPRPELHDDATDAEQTGEQPIIVIDADEPLAPIGGGEPLVTRPLSDRTKRPRFFGLRGRKKRGDDAQGAGWFSGNAREFNWDD